MFYVEVMCDKCGETTANCSRHVPKWLLVKIARENGWTMGKKHLCPKCKKKKSKEC